MSRQAWAPPRQWFGISKVKRGISFPWMCLCWWKYVHVQLGVERVGNHYDGAGSGHHYNCFFHCSWISGMTLTWRSFPQICIVYLVRLYLECPPGDSQSVTNNTVLESAVSNYHSISSTVCFAMFLVHQLTAFTPLAELLAARLATRGQNPLIAELQRCVSPCMKMIHTWV